MARTVHGDPQTLYRSKVRTLRAAVDLIRPEDTLAAPIATGQPAAFLHALAERSDYAYFAGPVHHTRTIALSLIDSLVFNSSWHKSVSYT